MCFGVVSRWVHVQWSLETTVALTDGRVILIVVIYCTPWGPLTRVLVSARIDTQILARCPSQAKWRDNCKRINPDWEFRIYTDDDNRKLVQEHYPWFLATYDSYPVRIAPLNNLHRWSVHQIHARCDHYRKISIESMPLEFSISHILEGSTWFVLCFSSAPPVANRQN